MNQTTSSPSPSDNIDNLEATIPPAYNLHLENIPDESSLKNLPEIPGYQLGKLLGKGGMGLVYEAKQLTFSRRCAIKFLLPKFAQNKHFADRFKREAQVMSRLQDPHIVQVLEFGETQNMLFLIMIYIVGPSGTSYDLRQHLAVKGGRLIENEVADIVDQVASALETAHHEGIVHRDVKPGNILLDTRNRAYVTDFGLAMERDSHLTQPGMIMGTINYMAPEQHHGVNVDHRTDIYSLTAITYELLTGRLPQGKFKPVTDLVPGLQADWNLLMERGLATDPDDRFSNFAEFRALLRTIARHASQVLLPSPKGKEVQSAIAKQPTLSSLNLSSTVLLQKAKEHIQHANEASDHDQGWRDAESAVVHLERLLQAGNTDPETKQLRNTADELSRRWARQALTEACQKKQGSSIRLWAQRLLDQSPEDAHAKQVLNNINEQYRQLRTDLAKAQEQRQLNRVAKLAEYLQGVFPDDEEVRQIAATLGREREEVDILLRDLKQKVKDKQWSGVQLSLEQLTQRQVRVQQADLLKQKARAAIQRAKTLAARAKDHLAGKQIYKAQELLTEALAVCPDCIDALGLEADLRHEQTALQSSHGKLSQYMETGKWRLADRLWPQVEESFDPSNELKRLRRRIDEGLSLAKSKLTLQVLSLAGFALILVLSLVTLYPATLLHSALQKIDNALLKNLAFPTLAHQMLTVMGLWFGMHYWYRTLLGAWPRKSDMAFILIFLLVPTAHLLPAFMELDLSTREYIRMASVICMVSLIILCLSNASVGSIFKQTAICLISTLIFKEGGHLLLDHDILEGNFNFTQFVDEPKKVFLFGLIFFAPTFIFWSTGDWRQRQLLPKLGCALILMLSVVPLHRLFPGDPKELSWLAILIAVSITLAGLAAYDLYQKHYRSILRTTINSALIIVFAAVPYIIYVLIRLGYLEMTKRMASLNSIFDQQYQLNFASTLLLPWWCTWGCLAIHLPQWASTPAGWLDLRAAGNNTKAVPLPT